MTERIEPGVSSRFGGGEAVRVEVAFTAVDLPELERSVFDEDAPADEGPRVSFP